MFASFYSSDLFSEMDRLHREMRRAADAMSPSIRGFAQGYPALNVGSTPSSVEIYAFAPGVDPEKVQIDLDRRVLTIAGERASSLKADDATGHADGRANGTAGAGNGSESKPAVHINERFVGRFRRVVSLPDDIDPNGVTADYRDGVLHVSVKRRESSQPRRIAVQ